MEPCFTAAAPGAAPGLLSVKDVAMLWLVGMPQRSSRSKSEVVPCELLPVDRAKFSWPAARSSKGMLLLSGKPVNKQENEVCNGKHGMAHGRAITFT